MLRQVKKKAGNSSYQKNKKKKKTKNKKKLLITSAILALFSKPFYRMDQGQPPLLELALLEAGTARASQKSYPTIMKFQRQFPVSTSSALIFHRHD
jgi:hypothetical protein